MKAIVSIAILVFFTCSLVSCTETVIGPSGPQGPQGPIGPQGPQGESGFVFEYTNVSFTGPSYELFLAYPDNFEGFDSDVALVYLLWEINEDGVEIWRPLPNSVFLDGYTLQYSYDFTKFDVRLYLDGNVDPDGLTAAYTDDFIARVVIVPGSFWDSGRIGYPSYQELEEVLGLPKFAVHHDVISRP